ncbi:hypothetical protein L484_016406 [Morus notabilis]|uniref:RPA-interacting protein central domain-containing protein n=1 Tax=Morus notabilis TaxID=981085 RepID=W9RW71_9ROSA|nr:hypothetical protein L484_016406 [Morus notabilis]
MNVRNLLEANIMLSPVSVGRYIDVPPAPADYDASWYSNVLDFLSNLDCSKNMGLCLSLSLSLVLILVSNVFMDLIKSAFKDIISDELKKLDSSSDDNLKKSTSIPGIDDILWEYDGLHDACQGESEETLIFFKEHLEDLSLFSRNFSSVNSIPSTEETLFNTL